MRLAGNSPRSNEMVLNHGSKPARARALLSTSTVVWRLKRPVISFQINVRFAGMVGFALLAYFSYEDNRPIEIIIYVALALLFQPFAKVALGRTIWNIVDVIVAVGLIGSLFLKNSKKE